MRKKDVSLGAYLVDVYGKRVSEITKVPVNVLSNEYNIPAAQFTIDYSSLGIKDLAGYTYRVAVFDNTTDYVMISTDYIPVIKKDRTKIIKAIEKWGTCRLVAITEKNGDIAVSGVNTVSYSGLGGSALSCLKDAIKENVVIRDIVLTENGSFLALYGDNLYSAFNMPSRMLKAIDSFDDKNEVVVSATCNDNGDWIVVSDKSFVASSIELQNEIQEGVKDCGRLISAHLTDYSKILIFEEGLYFYNI